MAAPVHPCHRITYSGQTRNICVDIKLTNIARLGSIVITYLDYPGQDHLSAYFILRGMNNLLVQVRNTNTNYVSDVVKELKDKAIKVAEAFLSPSVNIREKMNTIDEVIREPFKPFKGRVEDADYYSHVSIAVRSAYLIGAEEIDVKKAEDKVKELLTVLWNRVGDNIGGPRLNIVDAISWFLCELE
ncbi:MAG: hypothetical protein QXE66_04180, partial [Desulfurococcaceae archaeon]